MASGDTSTGLVLAIERLAENQSDMGKEIRELTKAISKMDVVLEKMVSIEDRQARYVMTTDQRLLKLEEAQSIGCPALRENSVKNEGRYEAVVNALSGNRERIDNIVKTLKWLNSIVVGAVIVALLASIGLK